MSPEPPKTKNISDFLVKNNNKTNYEQKNITREEESTSIDPEVSEFTSYVEFQSIVTNKLRKARSPISIKLFNLLLESYKNQGVVGVNQLFSKIRQDYLEE